MFAQHKKFEYLTHFCYHCFVALLFERFLDKIWNSMLDWENENRSVPYAQIFSISIYCYDSINYIQFSQNISFEIIITWKFAIAVIFFQSWTNLRWWHVQIALLSSKFSALIFSTLPTSSHLAFILAWCAAGEKYQNFTPHIHPPHPAIWVHSI